jgi:hypothetical protein
MNTEDLNDATGAGAEERLWDYIDGTATATEKTVIAQLIESNAAWRAKYNELLEVQQLIQTTELEEPSMRFTKNVMDEIAKLHIAPAAKNYLNKKVIRGLAFFFISIIVGFLIYGFGQIDWTVQGDTKMPVDLAKVDYSRIFNNNYVNVFMMINVILGLFLLDRFLANKRKEFQKDF